MLVVRRERGAAVVHAQPRRFDVQRLGRAIAQRLAVQARPAVDPHAQFTIGGAGAVELYVLLHTVPALAFEQAAGPGPEFAVVGGHVGVVGVGLKLGEAMQRVAGREGARKGAAHRPAVAAV